MFPTHLFGKCRRNFVAVDVSQGWVNNWEWTEMWSCFWGTKIRNCRQNTKRKGKDQRQDFLFQELLQFFRTVQHRVEYWSLSYSFPLRFYTVVSSLWKSDSVQSYVRVGVLREWRAYSFFSTYLSVLQPLLSKVLLIIQRLPEGFRGPGAQSKKHALLFLLTRTFFSQSMFLFYWNHLIVDMCTSNSKSEEAGCFKIPVLLLLLTSRWITYSITNRLVLP